MPRPRRASRRVGAVRGTRAAAEQRGDAGIERVIDLLRTDEMDVRVEAAGGNDLAFAGDDIGAGADDDGYAGLDVGIAGLADRRNFSFLYADIGLDYAPVVEDQRVGDDGVDGALFFGHLRLAHAVADHLAAAEFHLLAVNGEVFFDLDDEIGVGEPHFVARRRAEHVRINRAFHRDGHILSSQLSTAFRRLLRMTAMPLPSTSRSLMVGSAGHGWPLRLE